MKRIALSQAVVPRSDRVERCDMLDQRLCALLSSLGYVPVPVPNGLQPSLEGCRDANQVDDWMASVSPAAIVLSGGNDIGSCAERDQTELRLLDYARRHQLPTLGICRGMQMMSTWCGGTLRAVSGHVRTRHRLRGELTGEVNSFHNFALDNCPSEFAVIARSEDDSIEAIRHRSLPWEGWMWHPEREATLAELDLQRLQMLFGRVSP
jgi:N5-(cytidine 5'-diphosphoramidyl)-L-glutamine hydrolase